jgi:hypothetical protein
MNSGTAMRLTALAIALVFCIGMFSPLVAVAGTAEAPMPEAQQPLSLLGYDAPAESLAAEPQPLIKAAPVPVEPNTIVIQPNETVGKDANIANTSANGNFGNAEWMQLGIFLGFSTYRMLWFADMPSHPVEVKHATVQLYCHMTGSLHHANISVYPLTQSWVEGEVTWNERNSGNPWSSGGGDYDNTREVNLDVGTTGCWHSFNITDIVQDWVDGVIPNHGLIFIANAVEIGENARFYSSDYATDANLRPKFILSYAAEITTPVPAQGFQEDAPARSIPLSGRGAGSVEAISGVDAFGGTGSSYPFNGAGADQMHFQIVYNATQVGSEGVIRSLAFMRENPSDVGSFSNFKIMMAHTDKDVLVATFTDNYQGFLIEVFKEPTIFVNASNNDPWIHFNLNGNFTYDSKYNLLIDIQWNGDSGVTVPLLCSSSTTTKRVWDVSGNPSGTINSNPNVARFLVDVVDNAVVDDGIIGNYWPFTPGDEASMRMQMLYNQTLISQSGYIDKLEFQIADYATVDDWVILDNLVIRLAHTNLADLTPTFENNRVGAWTTVLSEASYNLSAPLHPGWASINIDNNFMYNGNDNLLIDITWNGGDYWGASGYGGPVLAISNAAGYTSRVCENDYLSATGATDDIIYNIRALFADSASLTWSTPTQPSSSPFTASVSGRTLIITPQPNQFGTGTVTLRLTNSNGEFVTQNIPVTITAVNDAPVLAAIPNQICVEDIPKTVNLVSYMSDVDDDVYSLTLTENSNYANVSGTNITFLYPEGISSQVVTVTISDPGGLTATRTINVTVTQINDPPYFIGFPYNITCDATVLRVVALNMGDEETPVGQLEIFTDSEYVNVSGQTLRLLYPKGIGTDQVTVYLMDNLTYGTQQIVSLVMNVTIIDHPEVTNHTPAGTSVPIISPVQATFDMPMNATTVENAFNMKMGTTPINGTFSWNPAGTVMTFTPESFMLAGNYTVAIAATAEEIGGVNMLKAYSWAFTVVYGDYDGDGMPDDYEIENGLDPIVDDSDGDLDGDGMPNGYEYENGLDPTVNDAAGDLDGDGMPNLYEFQNNLNPAVNDADEDADGDGYTNLEEYLAGTDPNDPESAPADFSWVILLLVLVAVIAVVLVLVMLMRKKKPAPAPEYQEGNYPPPPPAQEPYYPPPEGQGEPPMEPEAKRQGPVDPDSGLMPDTDPRKD